MSELLLLVSIGIAALSGIPGVCLRRWPTIGPAIAAAGALVSSTIGIAAVALFWITGDSTPIAWPWSLPGAEFHVAIDDLSAIFLLPIFVVSLVGSIFGLGYWRGEHTGNGATVPAFYGLLTAGMALVVIARNAVLFLFGWEIMALAAYFLVTTDDRDGEARQAGWVYLVATHLATLALVGLFSILQSAAGSYTLAPLGAGTLTPGLATAAFICALVGFGIKAGVMPFHVWLPGAHAAAPSHVSAIMSGVMIKMGIYGLVRTLWMLPDPPAAWGITVLVLGVVSGVAGVVFAIAQHDLKRLLAYHSIENIGIILMGLGLAMVGRSLDREEWVVLGLSGALLHVWNHALFKALLFLSAGSVVHATGTRQIDQLGGLAHRMPHTAFSFLVGAVAICGLPPLNGFVSELLIYLGLFASLDSDSGQLVAAGFAAAALALIGGLAIACFVKVYGVVFLGSPRSEPAAAAHEAPAVMRKPLWILIGLCFFIGLAPILFVPTFDKAVAAWAPQLAASAPSLGQCASLGWISAMAASLVVVLLAARLLLARRLEQPDVVVHRTWGCGYTATTPRMQYTSSSLGQMLVDLFAWVLRPHVVGPSRSSLFPRSRRFHSEVADLVLDHVVLPAARFGARAAAWVCSFQRRSIQFYLLYIFGTVLVLLLIW